MAYSAVKDTISDGDLRRFACCFLNLKDMNAIDWDAAAADFDANVKAASFKTVTSRAMKKALGAAGAEGEGGKKATKRKGSDDEGEQKKAKKAKGAKKGKKSTPEEDDAEAEPVIKAEGKNDQEE